MLLQIAVASILATGSLPALQAQEELRELRWRPDVRLSVDAVHDLVLRATGSEESAQEAARRYAADLLRAGETPT